MAEAHPDLDLTDTQLSNFLERSEVVPPPGDRRETIGTVEVVDLDTDRLDDLLGFFDGPAFAGNPGWASCYCMAHHIDEHTGDRWETRTWRDNRAALAYRVERGTTSGQLAYVDGELAGWCNASMLHAYPEYGRRASDGTVGGIACFIVAPEFRGHGLAPRLLTAAVARFRRLGARAVDAFPNPDPTSAAAAYKGTVAMFKAAGFARVEGKPPLRMRLELELGAEGIDR